MLKYLLFLSCPRSLMVIWIGRPRCCSVILWVLRLWPWCSCCSCFGVDAYSHVLDLQRRNWLVGRKTGRRKRECDWPLFLSLHDLHTAVVSALLRRPIRTCARLSTPLFWGEKYKLLVRKRRGMEFQLTWRFPPSLPSQLRAQKVLLSAVFDGVRRIEMGKECLTNLISCPHQFFTVWSCHISYSKKGRVELRCSL